MKLPPINRAAHDRVLTAAERRDDRRAALLALNPDAILHVGGVIAGPMVKSELARMDRELLDLGPHGDLSPNERQRLTLLQERQAQRPIAIGGIGPAAIIMARVFLAPVVADTNSGHDTGLSLQSLDRELLNSQSPQGDRSESRAR